MAGVQSVFPEAKWAQRRDQLLITFCVEDCQNASVKFEKSKIHFSGVTDKPRRTIYDTELELFKNINPEKSNWQQTSRNITVQACKGESGPFWPRLLLSTAKQHWLKTDFEKMKDEDDPSTEEGDTDEYEKSRQFFDDNADSLTPPGSTEDVSDRQCSGSNVHSVKPWLQQQLKNCSYVNIEQTANNIVAFGACYPDFRFFFRSCSAETGSGSILLCVTGSVSVNRQQGSYDFSLVMWVMRKYPLEPPILYVKSAEGMKINQSQIVDQQGRLRISVLDDWKDTYNLVDVLDKLRRDLSRETPVVIKKKRKRNKKKKKPSANENNSNMVLKSDDSSKNTTEPKGT